MSTSNPSVNRYANLRKQWDGAGIPSKLLSPRVFFNLKREEKQLNHAELFESLDAAANVQWEKRSTKAVKLQEKLVQSDLKYINEGVRGMRSAVKDKRGELYEYMKLHKGVPKSWFAQNRGLLLAAGAVLALPQIALFGLTYRANILSQKNIAKERGQIGTSMQESLVPYAWSSYFGVLDGLKMEGVSIFEEANGVSASQRELVLRNALLAKTKIYTQTLYGEGTNYIDAIAYCKADGTVSSGFAYDLSPLASRSLAGLLNSIKFEQYVEGVDFAIAGTNGFDLLGKGKPAVHIITRAKVGGEDNFVVIQLSEDNVYQNLFNAPIAQAQAENWKSGNNFGQKAPVFFMAGLTSRSDEGGAPRNEITIFTSQTKSTAFVKRALEVSGVFEKGAVDGRFSKALPLTVKARGKKGQGLIDKVQETRVMALPVKDHPNMVVGYIVSEDVIKGKAAEQSASFDATNTLTNRLWYGLSMLASVFGLGGIAALSRRSQKQAKMIRAQESEIVNLRRDLERAEAIRKFYKEALAPYVPRYIVTDIIDNEKMPAMVGETKELAVLFGDIAGYTKLSEGKSSARIVSYLNDLFTVALSPALARDNISPEDIMRLDSEGATTEQDKVTLNLLETRRARADNILNQLSPKAREELGSELLDFYRNESIKTFGLDWRKAIGDAVMLTSPAESVADAIEGLLFINRALRIVNKRLEAAGATPIHIRWGVHLGDLWQGILGIETERHFPDIMGDPVNTSSRLESLNKQLGTRMLLSSPIYGAVSTERRERMGLLCRDVGSFMFVGKGTGLGVYEVMNEDPEDIKQFKLETRDKFETAMRLIRGADVDKDANRAKEILDELMVLHNERFSTSVDADIKANFDKGIWVRPTDFDEEQAFLSEKRTELLKQHGDKPLQFVHDFLTKALDSSKTDYEISAGAFVLSKK